jgi:hypothetical protein
MLEGRYNAREIGRGNIATQNYTNALCSAKVYLYLQVKICKVDLGFRQITLTFFVKGKFFVLYTAFSSTLLYCIFSSKEKKLTSSCKRQKPELQYSLAFLKLISMHSPLSEAKAVSQRERPKLS